MAPPSSSQLDFNKLLCVIQTLYLWADHPNREDECPAELHPQPGGANHCHFKGYTKPQCHMSMGRDLCRINMANQVVSSLVYRLGMLQVCVAIQLIY